MPRLLGAEDMERIEIERVHRDQNEAVMKFVHRRKTQTAATAAVRITVVGMDGAVITDIWTRDRFREFVEMANYIIADG